MHCACLFFPDRGLRPCTRVPFFEETAVAVVVLNVAVAAELEYIIALPYLLVPIYALPPLFINTVHQSVSKLLSGTSDIVTPPALTVPVYGLADIVVGPVNMLYVVLLVSDELWNLNLNSIALPPDNCGIDIDVLLPLKYNP